MESFKLCGHLYVSNCNMKCMVYSFLLFFFIYNLSSDYYFFVQLLKKDALNETNPGMHITEDAILQIELGFRKMRELFQCTYLFI